MFFLLSSKVPLLLNLQGTIVLFFLFQKKEKKEIKCLADKTVIFPLEEAGTGKARKGER